MMLLIPSEVKCEYAGIPQGTYYTDLSAAIEVTERFGDAFYEATGYREPKRYAVPATAYEGIVALGGNLSFPRDHQPMLTNQSSILTTNESIDSLTVPDPDAQPRFRKLLEWRRELVRRFGDAVSGGIAGQEGPLTTAVLLRGQQFFYDCIDDPARAHRLLEICTDMLIRWTKRSNEENGITSRIASVCDDHAGLLGPDLWDEFVIPCYQRITDALGPDGFWIHTELVNRSHLPHLLSLPLVGVNFAEDQYLSIRDVQETLPGVPFGWHILTVSEMLQGTPELIRRRCREIHAAGVDEIRCELTVGTPPENIRAFLDMERELA
jgi:uroporphyrinogen-III decarboxylase